MIIKDKRNQFVDIMRGVAMLLVVFGHTLTVGTTNAEESFLYNVVWSLQMPLFILISGYVTRYSKYINDGVGIGKYIIRRTIAYLLPWAVWSFIIRGFILGEDNFMNINWLLWHMDSGYWFLVTIWTISILFGISSFTANKVVRNSKNANRFANVFIFSLGILILAAVGHFVGFSFFAIKLSLYYSPFYLAGYLYGQYRDKIHESKAGKSIVDILILVSLLIWLYIIYNVNLFSLPDISLSIAIRLVSSITGCIAIIGLFKGLFIKCSERNYFNRFLRWIGVHSLEIYLTHYLFLSAIKMPSDMIINSVQGIALVACKFIVTVILTMFAVMLLNTNRFLRILLYGNRE